MLKSVSNESLYRPILNGSLYETLFSSSNCEKSFLGSGDTKFTINEMKDWVHATKSQLDTEKTKKIFLKSDLTKTVKEIKYFVYNHFSYKADTSDQYLLSPNCAWQMRYKGFDCKNYSTLTSVILSLCNISHYIRRIKQPSFNTNNFTHVYIIVPFDQINSDLSKGYHTIDGTIRTSQEPQFTEKHDIYMSKMEHYGLMGVSNDLTSNLIIQKNEFLKGIQPYVCSTNLNLVDKYISDIINAGEMPQYVIEDGCSVSGLAIPFNAISGLNGGLNDTPDEEGKDGFIKEIKGFLKDIDFGSLFGSISGILGNLDCIGGTTFNEGRVNQTREIITNFFSLMITRLNELVVTYPQGGFNQQHSDAIGIQLTNFMGYSIATAHSYHIKKGQKRWNSCSNRGLDSLIKLSEFYRDKVHLALNKWLDQYFIGELTHQHPFSFPARHLEMELGFHGCWIGGDFPFTSDTPIMVDVRKWTPKPKSIDIKQFEFTAPLTDTIGTDNQVNFDSLFNSFQNVIATTSPAPNNNGGANNGGANNGGVNNGGANNGGNAGTGTFQTPTTATAGTSKILAFTMLSIAGGMIYKKYKENKK